MMPVSCVLNLEVGFMSHVINDNKYAAEILLENGNYFLSQEDKQSIENVLNKVNIWFDCIELRSGPHASLFRGIAIFINENLTSLLIGSLLMPGAYDAMKFVFKKIINGIKNGPVRMVGTKKSSMPTLILRFVTKTGHIDAPIPTDL